MGCASRVIIKVLCPASVTRFKRTVEIRRAVTKTIAELIGRGLRMKVKENSDKTQIIIIM